MVVLHLINSPFGLENLEVKSKFSVFVLAPELVLNDHCGPMGYIILIPILQTIGGFEKGMSCVHLMKVMEDPIKTAVSSCCLASWIKPQ